MTRTSTSMIVACGFVLAAGAAFAANTFSSTKTAVSSLTAQNDGMVAISVTPREGSKCTKATAKDANMVRLLVLAFEQNKSVEVRYSDDNCVVTEVTVTR